MKRSLLLVLVVACSKRPERPAEAPQRDTQPVLTQRDTHTVITRFDPVTIKVGDTVAGLRLSKRDAVINPASPLGVTGSLRFIGEVRLAGDYRGHFDFPEVQKPCFWVDREDWYKLPRAEKETRIVWFCFTNDEAVIKQLGPLSKDTTRAVIVIDDYTTNLFESDVWDTARLVRVISRSTSTQ